MTRLGGRNLPIRCELVEGLLGVTMDNIKRTLQIIRLLVGKTKRCDRLSKFLNRLAGGILMGCACLCVCMRAKVFLAQVGGAMRPQSRRLS